MSRKRDRTGFWSGTLREKLADIDTQLRTVANDPFLADVARLQMNQNLQALRASLLAQLKKPKAKKKKPPERKLPRRVLPRGWSVIK